MALIEDCPMKAVIRQGAIIACPFCTNPNHQTYRREPAGNGSLTHWCRCAVCGEDFHYHVDRVGKPFI